MSTRTWISMSVVLMIYLGSHAATGQVIDVAEQARASKNRLSAAIASVDGTHLRDKLVHSAPSGELARWYAGEVQIEGRWLHIDEAQRLAEKDATHAEYRELRRQSVDQEKDHERLARWCEKHDLPHVAKVHWLHILRFDNKNRAALNQLGLTWYDGMLLTPAEAKLRRERQREWLKENKVWQSKVKSLRRDLERGDPQAQLAAQRVLHEIQDPAAVPALLDELSEPAQDQQVTVSRRTELLKVLSNITADRAAVAVAEFAAFDPNESVRYVARDQLKSMPLESYVPALLGGMAMPVEASVSIDNIGNRVVSSYSYSQEKPGGNEVIRNRQASHYVSEPRYHRVAQYRKGAYRAPRTIEGKTVQVPIIPGHGKGYLQHERRFVCSDGNLYTHVITTEGYGPEYLKEVKLPDKHIPGYYEKEFAGIGSVENPAFSARQQAVRRKSQQQALQAQRELELHNEATRVQNQQIVSVLKDVTGETLSASPKLWWNWWSEYLDHHPDAATTGTRLQLNRALLNQQQRGLARGTWVWTSLGKRRIETVLPGDFVLSQDPRTGELAYQVLLAISAHRPTVVSRVETQDAELFCASGHVLWETGSGWQRVSNIAVGQPLHGATEEHRLTHVQPTFEIASYDLIVDGFHTYFVGEQGLLTHDATPIAPSHVALPGFSPAAVANAAELVAKRVN